MTKAELMDRLISVPEDAQVVISLTDDAYEAVDIVEVRVMYLEYSFPDEDYELYPCGKKGETNAVVLFMDGSEQADYVMDVKSRLQRQKPQK